MHKRSGVVGNLVYGERAMQIGMRYGAWEEGGGGVRVCGGGERDGKGRGGMGGDKGTGEERGRGRGKERQGGEGTGTGETSRGGEVGDGGLEHAQLRSRCFIAEKSQRSPQQTEAKTCSWIRELG